MRQALYVLGQRHEGSDGRSASPLLSSSFTRTVLHHATNFERPVWNADAGKTLDAEAWGRISFKS